MKRLIIDPGQFYIKVICQEYDGDRFVHFGQMFLPAIYRAVNLEEQNFQKVIFTGDHGWAVGYEALKYTRDFAESLALFSREEKDYDLLFRKILSDYAEDGEAVEMVVALHSAALLEKILPLSDIYSKAWMNITYTDEVNQTIKCKKVSVNLHTAPVSDGILHYLSSLRDNIPSALVVDVGFEQTKLYMVHDQGEVVLFRSIPLGMSDYYQSFVRFFTEKGISSIHFLWFVKQMEMGCSHIEIEDHDLEVDISMVVANVRWDLSKNICRAIEDLAGNYYENTTKWPAMLVIMGGGALFNGDIVSYSLSDKGSSFQDVHVDSSSIYAIAQGVAQNLTFTPEKKQTLRSLYG